MDMKLPGSGSWLDGLLGDSTGALTDTTGVVVSAVTEPQLSGAIDAMVRGEIEFVILEDGDAFMQSAGQDNGPYELNYRTADDETLYEVPGGVTAAAMRTALLSYRRDEASWHAAHRWSPV